MYKRIQRFVLNTQQRHISDLAEESLNWVSSDKGVIYKGIFSPVFVRTILISRNDIVAKHGYWLYNT